MRNSQPDELANFTAIDKIPGQWEVFIAAMTTKPYISGNNLHSIITSDGVTLLSISSQLEITYFISV